MFQQYGVGEGVDVQKTASFFKVGIKGTATRLAGAEHTEARGEETSASATSGIRF